MSDAAVDNALSSSEDATVIKPSETVINNNLTVTTSSPQSVSVFQERLPEAQHITTNQHPPSPTSPSQPQLPPPPSNNFYNSPSLITTSFSQPHSRESHAPQTITTTSSQTVLQPRLFMPHKTSRRFARIFLFLLFVTTILFFFLSFDCWPALSSLFDIRRSSSSDNSCGGNCFFHNRGLKPFPVTPTHSQTHHSNSLLARPLKHLSNSFSLARLSPERIEALMKKVCFSGNFSHPGL